VPEHAQGIGWVHHVRQTPSALLHGPSLIALMTLWIFKKDIHADDGTWIDVRNTILFAKTENFQNAIIHNFTKNDRKIYQKIINPGLNNVVLSA
jgi:hypothetical protein